ncbi:MAG: hypothetical protein FJ225_03895 [Lentisphaerae bacterium]|nr:hypothetical protein [Lentisphaerota bacterium]
MILDWLSRLNARERLGLTAAALVILGMLVDRLAVQAVVNRSRELSREIARSEAEVAYNLRVLAGKAAVETEYRRLLAAMEAVQSEAEGIDRMKDQIDALAREAGVRLDSWEERRPENRGAYDEHFVVVRQFDSGMDGVLRFLYDVRSAPGLMRVEQIRVGPVRDTDRMRGSLLISKVFRKTETK